MDFTNMTQTEIMAMVASGKLTKVQLTEAFNAMASVAAKAQDQVRQMEAKQKPVKGKRALEKERREQVVSTLLPYLADGNYFAQQKDIGEFIAWALEPAQQVDGVWRYPNGEPKPVVYATVKSLFKEAGYQIHVRPVIVPMRKVAQPTEQHQPEQEQQAQLV